MSDNINESINLCVPEDAFEKFQAVNTCEEDEFITLEDIVPTPAPTGNRTSCLDDIQDDICIIDEPDVHTQEKSTSEWNTITNHPLLGSTNVPADQNEETKPTDALDASKNIFQTSPTSASVYCDNLDHDYGEECKTLSSESDHCNKNQKSPLDISDTYKDNSKITDEISTTNQTSSERNNSRQRKRKIPVYSEVSSLIEMTKEIATSVPTKKRGRPKKISMNESVTIKPFQSNAKETSDKKSGRRAQKNKIETDTVASCSSDVAHSSIDESVQNVQDISTSNSSKRPTRHARAKSMSVYNEDNYASDSSFYTSKRKSRYSKKQKKTEANQDTDAKCSLNVSNSSTDTSAQNVQKNENNCKSHNEAAPNSQINNACEDNVPEKVGDTSKIEKQKVDKKYDDIELELIRILSSTPNNSKDDKDDVKDISKNQNLLKKRGRKPKKQTDVQAINLDKSQDNEKLDLGDEEGDDVCLSSLKKQLKSDIEMPANELCPNVNTEKIEEKSMENPEVTDLIQNNESIINESNENIDESNKNIDESNENIDESNENIANATETNDNEVESPSKRPVRRRAKKILHYDEGSDEDPFANIELSDDDVSGRRAGRYYSDEEYVPGKRKKGKAYIESSMSEESEDLDNEDELILKKQVHKRRGRKSDESQKNNPFKRKKIQGLDQDASNDVTSTAADTTTQIDDDVDQSVQSPDITTNESTNQKPYDWGGSHEFENFIAKKIQGTNLQIKKLSSATQKQNVIAPLEIPVLDPNEPKKFVETCTQTFTIKKKTVEVQTTTPYESTMKTNVPLTFEQSTKACDFLKGIVKTTSDLGQLMIEKSEDFIQKKINTKNVIDTSKMDYCVQKSFLLFKLARHNLIKMEEDLANEYEQFLKNNNMLQYRETPKCIKATPKPASSDSDCEIVEEPAPSSKPIEKNKSKFNLKTVFLNKELSIKIAKKSDEPQINKEKINVKGRHTVWINDSIMVKKVKPTQSFLAQDSRNKKPPDTFVTIDMVKKFFDEYSYKQNVIKTCAPLVSPEWLHVNQIGVCYYFIAQTDLTPHSAVLLSPQTETASTIVNEPPKLASIDQPKSLKALCTKKLQEYLYKINDDYNSNNGSNSIAEKIHYQPETLFTLSFNLISKLLVCDNTLNTPKMWRDIISLQLISINKINDLLHNSPEHSVSVKDISQRDVKICKVESNFLLKMKLNKQIKTLFSLCVERINKTEFCLQNSGDLDINKNKVFSNTTDTLKSISLKKVKEIFSDLNDNVYKKNTNAVKPLKCIAFAKVKSLIDFVDKGENNKINVFKESQLLENKSEETMALTIECVNTVSEDIFSGIVDSPQNEDSDFSNCDQFEQDYGESISNQENFPEECNWVSKVQLQELKSCFIPSDDNQSKTTEASYESNEQCVTAQIKIEPLDEVPENVESTIIKTEPEVEGELINFTPLNTKLEKPYDVDNGEHIMHDRNSNSYDEEAFETFAKSSKMLQEATNYTVLNDEIFSQSALRVRRQYEPDVDDDSDAGMSLLVPQENIEVAKGRLMETSSDDDTDAQKSINKKKRRGRRKGSRAKNKDSANKDKTTPENEVALLTKKMQDKIRQEEKVDESSDSELENSLALRRENSKNSGSDKPMCKTDKTVENLIQCNDVDSTENLILGNDTKAKASKRKTLSNKDKENDLLETNNSLDDSFVMKPDEPVELLECEPTLPMMHDMENLNDNNVDETFPEKETIEELPYIERHGWKCFSVNTSDTKLYQQSYILLEKLPESFVETYFRYLDMADKDENDTDVDRLTNLQTLHRNLSKESKGRSKPSRVLQNEQLKKKGTENCSRSSSPANDEDCHEFSPSEDEGANIDDEIAPPVPHRDVAENAMAKNCLMNDVDSDTEKPKNDEKDSEGGEKTNVEVKKEITEDPSDRARRRPGPKSKCKEIKELDSLMLTADKMMNKELSLLHAPVMLDADKEDVKDSTKKPSKPKGTSKHTPHLEHTIAEEDSSSEEEKQWVSTKEKLLKRLEKRQENPRVDDAKRAKIVSEFIERRGDAQEKRPRGRARSRRSSKKFLERQKQISVLNRELFGEVDASHAGRKHSNTFGKGRRNIRKVIDKKSLARSTVIANMEEFERKRRLNMQQTRLREQLGCEEGVSVLVINDEVCLEYDFEEMRPVVTVHPFFTKVMKAHQYEGVKFMWDACFESLAMVQSGHAGGGCILAHCMGLGKTLQVLALLHTVLTNPRVGMQRVLVCCPLSTVLNWVDEIHKWIGPVTNQIKVFELSKLKKTYERAYQLEDWFNGGGIFIIGYELFRSLTTLDAILDDIRPTIVNKIRTALLDPGPDMVICDEGHLLKNDASVLAVAMSRVATRRRIVLTGTPMQNNLREYYCMVNFVKPSLLGTYSEYSNRFENPIMNGQHRDSREEDIKLMKARTHILHKVLEGCLQRQEASVLYPYLPKKHEYTVFIPPTKCQWDLYKHYMMTYALQQQQEKKHSVLKDFHVLQKIWTHPQVLHNFLMKGKHERHQIKVEKLEDDLAQEDLAASEDIKPNQMEVWWLQYLEGGDMLESLESSNKFLVVFQLLEECISLGDKVLIFSTSLYTMDALEYFLKNINKWSLGQEYYRLDGSVPAEVRQKWCREFNAEHNVNTKLFLISTRAGSLGLNMTAANRVIILDTSWNPAHDIQSIFRVYRFGQKKDCYIYRLVAMGTMEQKIYERAVTKQAVACRVVDEQQIDRHYNMSELTELYRYDEEGTSVEAGLAAGVADVALLRVAARARLHAVREHDSLLRGSREQHLPEHERAAAWMQFQQEHANEEMQDRLMKANQGIQHLLTHDYTVPSGLVPVKLENGLQPLMALTNPQPKGKKGRKGAAANNLPPTPDNNMSQMYPDKEDAKVKMIMKLLIRHNFLTTRPPHEIAQLVSNVRRIVAAGGAGLEECDELTRSIATVMLQEENSPTAPESSMDDLITGDLDTPHIPVEVKQEALEQSPESEQIDSDMTSVAPDESCLLVPVREVVRKQRGRPRKCSVQEQIEPVMKRPRGRPRKYTDTDGMDSSSSSSSVITYKRARIGPRSHFSSDVDDSMPGSCRSSKESSPGLNDEPGKSAKKPTVGRQISTTSESEVSTMDDDNCPPLRDENNSIVLDDDESTDGDKDQSKKTIKNTPKSCERVQKDSEVKKPDVEEPKNLSGKSKRKAALAAKQHFEEMEGGDIVSLDDDDDDWVDDSQDSEVIEVPQTKNRDKTKPSFDVKFTYKNKHKQTEGTSKGIKGASKDKIVKKNDDKSEESAPLNDVNSILLSDDDDSPERVAETPKETTSIAKKGEGESTTQQPQEEIALHPSMLANPNFIKIVAYAYQSNRMLDEDAALLAAQYSTQKALKEIEATGKEITSGPLYDIAIKVLGVDILKKLHSKKDKKKTSDPPPSSATESTKQDRELPKIMLKASQLIPLKADKEIKHKPAPASVANARAAEKTITKPSSPDVVPVGMFKGPPIGMNHKPDMVEECILPDDDLFISNPPTPVAPSTSNTGIFNRPNSSPLIITSVSSSKKPEPVRQIISDIEIIGPDLVPPVLIGEQQEQRQLQQQQSKQQQKLQQPQQLQQQSSQQQHLQQQGQQSVFLTISNGKLVMPHSNKQEMKVNNVVRTAVSGQEPPRPNKPPASNDTICLDSDEEDLAGSVTNVAQKPTQPAIQQSNQPIPVPVTTKVPGYPNQILQTPVVAYPEDRPFVIINQGPNENAQPTMITSNLVMNQQKGLVLVPSMPDAAKQQSEPSKVTNKIASTTPKLVGKQRDSPIKKVCKAGDIVRITKNGSLEVLKRIDKVPDTVLHAVDGKRSEGNVMGSKQPTVDKRKPTSSVTKSNDTLSIFKDVIHIQADEYEAKTPPVSTNTPANVSMNTSTKVVNVKYSLKTKTQDKAEQGKYLVKTLGKAEQNKLVSKAPATSELNKLKVDQNKMVSMSLRYFDKTNKSEGSNSGYKVIFKQKPEEKNNTNSYKPKPKTASSTIQTIVTPPKKSIVTGSSKDIIIRAKPSGSQLLQSSTTASNVRIANVKAVCSSQPADAKKRLSLWSSKNAAKKPKTSGLKPTLTLKDFNLDDIDDIIELE